MHCKEEHYFEEKSQASRLTPRHEKKQAISLIMLLLLLPWLSEKKQIKNNTNPCLQQFLLMGKNIINVTIIIFVAKRIVTVQSFSTKRKFIQMG